MIASNLSGFSGPSFNVVAPINSVEIAPQTIGIVKETKKEIMAEDYIRNYFSDIPIMIEIARCESRFRQYDKNGKVLRGEVNSLDRGIMQINEYYHNDTSDNLGYDILTIEGNTAYARALFEKSGVRPWASSSKCWSNTTAYAEYIKDKELAIR